MGTQQTAATAAAGNTVETLRSTPVEVAANLPTEAQMYTYVAKRQAAITPKPTPAASPTGPAPIEYAPPVLGRKSPDGSNADVLDGSKMQPDVVSKSRFTKPLVSRDEFNELLDRIDNFNNRSSQKI